MPIIFAGIDAVYAASNPIAAAAMLLATLLASGIAVGAIHGLVLVRMLRFGDAAIE
jgi:hypothetical protein